MEKMPAFIESKKLIQWSEKSVHTNILKKTLKEDIREKNENVPGESFTTA
jgi:hypothetical protein